MQKTLVVKIFIILLLTAGIMLVLGMIQSTIEERKGFHDEAIRSIATDSVREQSVVGPLLVIPYTDDFQEPEETTVNDKKVVTLKQKWVHHTLIVYPNKLKINGDIDIDQRYRGIHKVLVYTGAHQFSGDFTLPRTDTLERTNKSSKLTLGQAYVAIGIDDVRGVHEIPPLNWNGNKVEFQQGTGLTELPSGVNAAVGLPDLETGASMNFSFDLKLDGIERLAFVPIAKNNEVTLTSKWPHPEFAGHFLPSPHGRRIDNNGFTAIWNISSLASNAQPQLTSLLQRAPTTPITGNAQTLSAIDDFSVGFIEPVNIYSQADRAIKYGLLFVGLTFAAFFLFEVLKQLPIHPVQYGLVGTALALFFLLLISLSEHMEFAYAYLIAGCACILLNGFYLSYVLHNWKRGFGFGAALTLLYSVLYGLLQSENNALLMGSILLFSLLSAAMIATRKVDWYQIGKAIPPTGTETIAA